MKKTVLVTNDDGIRGKGLRPLINELKKQYNVVVVVPEYDRSAVSHSITLNKPLHVKQVGKQVFTTDGTPADCARFAIIHMLNKKVDLVISGINTGPNLGQDVIYSGTVAAAREGALLDIPAFAVSVADMNKPNYKLSAKISKKLADKILKNHFPKGVYLNVNIPYKVRGSKIVELGKRIYDDDIECRKDPRGRSYYWLAGRSVSGLLQAGMDVTAVNNGYVSITPIEVTPPSRHLFKYFKKGTATFLEI